MTWVPYFSNVRSDIDWPKKRIGEDFELNCETGMYVLRIRFLDHLTGDLGWIKAVQVEISSVLVCSNAHVESSYNAILRWHQPCVEKTMRLTKRNGVKSRFANYIGVLRKYSISPSI